MKTVSTSKSKGLFLSLGLGLLSFTGFSQEHMTLSLENITSTSTTIEYDLFIVNDGTTALKLAAYAYGINYNGAILNGGVPSETAYAYTEGSRTKAFSSLTTYNMLNTTKESANQLRFTMKPALKANCPNLVANVPYKVGHFKFTNTKAWANNSNPSISFNEFNIPGLSTSCALAYINSGENYKGFSVAKKNLSVRVANSPVLNPTSVTDNSSILNGSIKMNNTEIADTKITMYPNPTQDVVNVDFNSASISNTLVKVTDIRGRIVKQIQARSEKGFNTVSVSLREVPSGVYTVQLFENNFLRFTNQVTKRD